MISIPGNRMFFYANLNRIITFTPFGIFIEMFSFLF
jgi:hypothetical protein